MADGAKLASGYIELTVKTGAALKEITDALAGLGKDAEKTGQQIGTGLNKGISDGLQKNSGKSGNSLGEQILLGKGGGNSTATKEAAKTGEAVGKSLGDALTKATQKAGSDAGDAISGGITKGATQGAQAAGKSVGDEITKAAKKAGVDVAQTKIEPKITPKVDTKATQQEAKATTDILGDVLDKGAEQAGKKVGQVLGSAINDAVGVDLGGAATKVRDTLEKAADSLGVDLGSVVNNTLDKGLKNSVPDLISGLGSKLGAKLGSAVKDQVADITGINLEDVSGRLKDLSGVVNSFRGGNVRGGAGGAADLLDSLGVPGGGVANEVLNTYDQSKSVLDQVGQTAGQFGGESIAAALAGPEFAIPAAAGALGFVGGKYLFDKTGVTQSAINSVHTDTSPEALGIPRVPAGPNQLSTPVVPVPGLPTDTRFPAVAPPMNTSNLPSIAPLDLPDDPKNPTGRTGINYVIQDSHTGGGTSNVSAQVADVSAASAVVTAGSVSLGGISLPSVVTVPSSGGSVASPIGGSTSGAAHPTVVTPHGVSPINPIDILAPMDTPKKHAKGGVAGRDSSGRLFGPGSGTSDSILGLDASGMPTALVSNGEGVVKDSVMQSGGDQVVSALNSGADPNSMLIGYATGGMIPAPRVGGSNPTPGDPSHSVMDFSPRYTGDGLPKLPKIPGGFSHILSTDVPHFDDGGQVPPPWLQNAIQNSPPPSGESAKMGDQQPPMPPPVVPPPPGDGVNPLSAPGDDVNPLPPPGDSINPLPPTGDDPASLAPTGAPGGIGDRTQGYIPAGAGGSGQAGSSLFSGILQNGAQAINGIIDQAASAASSAAGMAASAFAPGSGGAASGAAASAIGLGTGAAKRGVSYGFQLGGIWGDALTEIFSPFGVSRFFQTDPTQFMPHIGAQPTAVTTGEKATLQGDQKAAGESPNPSLSPSGPVQPGQLPGAQPVAAPAPMAGPTGIVSAPVPIGAAPGGGPAVSPPPPDAAPTPVAPAVPNPSPSPIAAPVPKSGPQAGQQPPAPQQNDFFNSVLGNLGVFDDGGWLMPGSVAINQSKRPEPVFNGDQWNTLQGALGPQQVGAPDPAANGGGHDYSVHFHDTVVKDVDELSAKATSQQKLQMMRYAGRP